MAYYGNGCGEDGDGIGGAMAQLGMFRAASRGFIRIIEKLLFELLDDVIYLSAPRADDEWSELGNGFAARGADFSDFACVLDGTRIRTRRPRDHQGFYDVSGKPSFNCLTAIDYRYKFRYLLSGINLSGTSLSFLEPRLEICARQMSIGWEMLAPNCGCF